MHATINSRLRCLTLLRRNVYAAARRRLALRFGFTADSLHNAATCRQNKRIVLIACCAGIIGQHWLFCRYIRTSGKFNTLRDSGTGHAELTCAGEGRAIFMKPHPSVGRDPRPRLTSIGQNSDCVVKSAQGALVRGSGPPYNSVTEFTRRPVICGGHLSGVWEKNIWQLVYRKQTS